MAGEEKDAVDPSTIFYATVGHGISGWASMEGWLVQVAAKLLGATEEKTGLLLYSMNFFAWLNVIDELFSMEPKFAEFKADWGSISAKLRTLNDTRVRLAHHTTWDGSHHPGQLRLRPSKFDTRPKSKKYAPLSATEILAFIEAAWAVEN